MSDSDHAPIGLRGRVQLLYRSRRQRLLEAPSDALARRFGADSIDVDRTEFRYARMQVRPDLTVEAGFAGVFRMFGALIDTHWIGRRGSPPTAPVATVRYRFDLGRFKGTGPDADALALGLSSVQTRDLAKQAELKSIRVEDWRGGRLVDITPLPGTITAMYFPPLPPYTVPIRPEEADVQLALLVHLVDQ